MEWLALVPHSKKAFVWHLHVLSMPGDILVSSHCARTCSLHVPCFSPCVSWFQRPAGDPELDFFLNGRMIIFVSFCSYSLLPMPFFLFLFCIISGFNQPINPPPTCSMSLLFNTSLSPSTYLCLFACSVLFFFLLFNVFIVYFLSS